MKPIAIACVSLYFLCTISFAEEANFQDSPIKKEAREFSLQVVETFFTQDCDQFHHLLADTFVLLDGDGEFSKDGELKEKLCQSIKLAISDKSKTFDDYVKYYQIDIFTRSEIEHNFDFLFPDNIDIRETDLFYVGMKFKDGGKAIEHFIWDDLFFFMVRKTDETWSIKGLSG